mmetsp:Transcript_139974/g.247392  ORF Transcript_139974/g.247392 Transcript_139974/m.247392 type:complete len:261 (+) Transcript_139974:849-1631(+)
MLGRGRCLRGEGPGERPEASLLGELAGSAVTCKAAFASAAAAAAVALCDRPGELPPALAVPLTAKLSEAASSLLPLASTGSRRKAALRSITRPKEALAAGGSSDSPLGAAGSPAVAALASPPVPAPLGVEAANVARCPSVSSVREYAREPRSKEISVRFVNPSTSDTAPGTTNVPGLAAALAPMLSSLRGPLLRLTRAMSKTGSCTEPVGDVTEMDFSAGVSSRPTDATAWPPPPVVFTLRCGAIDLGKAVGEVGDAMSG